MVSIENRGIDSKPALFSLQFCMHADQQPNHNHEETDGSCQLRPHTTVGAHALRAVQNVGTVQYVYRWSFFGV